MAMKEKKYNINFGKLKLRGMLKLQLPGLGCLAYTK